MNVLELNLILILVNGFFFLLIIRTNLSKKLFILITSIQLIVFNGLRSLNIGNDTNRYYSIYLRIKESYSFRDFLLIDTDFGFKLLQKVTLLFTEDFHIWLLFVALFTFIPLGLFIYRNSTGYFFSYLLFIGMGYYAFSFTGTRQTIAMIIVLLSYKYILNKNLFKFLVILILAVSFHSSAIVFLPMYFVAQVNFSKYYFLSLLGFYILVYIFRFPIGELMTKFYYDENATLILNKYDSVGDIGGVAILLLLIILMGLFVYNPMKYKDKENRVLINIIIISFLIQMLSSFSYLFTRLNMYYLIFLILYIPHILTNIDKMPINMTPLETRSIRGFVKGLVIVLISLYYIKASETDGSGIIPYYFFWE
ncbi:EpsG family protein [Oceanobacillus salinisoli]|uniref:EpsG family protein n=1 Tax=Oceanobacillus salinisoli TaxID=2678611 RepID=UPI0012E2837B|nr:EpsG family protein [Oceanobacillus salinisoli]